MKKSEFKTANLFNRIGAFMELSLMRKVDILDAVGCPRPDLINTCDADLFRLSFEHARNKNQIQHFWQSVEDQLKDEQ